MNLTSEDLVNKVRKCYEESRDFNGLPVRALKASDSRLRAIIIELIKSGEIDLVRGDVHPNPHIKALAAEPIDLQIEKINKLGLGEGCLYPTQKHLEKFGTRCSRSAPFTLELELGAPQLDFRAFDVRVLDWYRDDPRFEYEVDDVHGQIRRKPEAVIPHSGIAADRLEFFEFGFAYGKRKERAVAALLRYLNDLPSDQQRHFAEFQLQGHFELHPDFYLTQIVGDFPIGMSIFDVFLLEKRTINELCEKIGKPGLFRTADGGSKRPTGFWILPRPTRKEFNDFVQLLDKLLGGDLNREFFKGDIPISEVLKREDGSEKKVEIPTITLLDRWLAEYFLPKDPAQIEELLRGFRDIRNVRNRPAHAVEDDHFDPEYLETQRELIGKGLRVVRMVRTILQNHPDAHGYQVPSQLEDSRIWIR